MEETIILEDFNEVNVNRALSGIACRQLIHLAAYGHHPYDNDHKIASLINTNLLPNIVKIINREMLESIIALGSCAEYANSTVNNPYKEDSKLELEKMYGSTKVNGGINSLKLCEALGIPFVYLRLFHSYGYGEEDYRLIPYLIRNLIQEKQVKLSAGHQIRDFLYISDAVEAILMMKKLLDSGKLTSNIFNLASGKGFSIKHIARTVAKICRSSEDLLSFGEVLLRPGEIPYLVANIDKIQKNTGWHPKIELEEGVQKYLDMIIKDDLIEK